MTGTIKYLDSAASSGAIEAVDGLVFGFRPSEVLACDVPGLAVGQAVSFDLEDGKHPRAVNVCVQRALRSSQHPEKRLEITRLRYVGFKQEGEIRSYRFELFPSGEARATFVVNSDLGLFTRHHVGLQEGPGLCLHLLAARSDLSSATAEVPLKCSLTDEVLLAYLAARPALRAKRNAKHTI